MNTNKQQKKAYAKPRIVPQGSVEKITLDQDKKLGISDGYTFMGAPITNAS